jgi:hypothetical protein
MINSERGSPMTSRILPCAGVLALAAQVFIHSGCGGSNDPILQTGTGGHVDATGTGGTPAPAGTGGAPTSGSGGSTATGTGGNLTTPGTGGGTATGTGGGTAAGTGGTTADGGGFGQPMCPTSVAKGGDCTATDPQLCYKTCGPEKTGVKSETCTSAKYAEMSGCSFDSTVDYSCYKIPTAANAACPAGMPSASTACTVDHCVLCNSTGGLPGGMYSDSGGMAKSGYCVCQVAGSSGTRNWSCATDTAWPCPLGKGC